jgi:cellulose synthase/poly-beta-1,6-N-acetylglucosamine synthase-like glycosyltransferase
VTNQNISDPRHQLDAEKNIKHWSYRVPGLLVWTLVFFFILMMFFAPNGALEIARIVGFYGLLRIVWYVLFYMLGFRKLQNKQREISQNPIPKSETRHLVLVPSYKEPEDVLAATLESIAQSSCAREKISVVLAMEARDPNAKACSANLYQRFEKRFADMLVTFHPDDLPGEVQCKGANISWAAREYKRKCIDRDSLDISQFVVTACDSDSHFHPAYFDELGRMYEADSARHNRIWHAPLLLDTNIWKVPTSIRLVTYFMNAIQISAHTDPLSFIMPYSTYSLSYKTLDAVGFWDPAVISEDYHIYMRCMYALKGNIKLVSVMLPTHGEAVSGNNSLQAWMNCYKQKVRHAWGIEDMSYLFQQWNKNPGTALSQKMMRLSKMFFDHIVVAILPVVIFLGSALAIVLKGEPILTVANNYAFPPIVLISNGLSLVATVLIWVLEHWRCAKTHEQWTVTVLASELVTWIVMPVFSLLVLFLPDLHAQTKMLLGSPLAFVRTPKGLDGVTD